MEVQSTEAHAWALPTRMQAPATSPAEARAETPVEAAETETDAVEGDEREHFRARHGHRRHHHHHEHEGRAHRAASDMGRRVAMGHTERGFRSELRELGRELRTDLREAAQTEDGQAADAESFLEGAISALGEFATGLEEAFASAQADPPDRGRGHHHGHHHRAERRAMRLERRYERMQSALTELTSQLQSMLDAIRGEEESANEDEVDVPITTGDPIREPRPEQKPAVAPEGAENATTA